MRVESWFQLPFHFFLLRIVFPFGRLGSVRYSLNRSDYKQLAQIATSYYVIARVIGDASSCNRMQAAPKLIESATQIDRCWAPGALLEIERWMTDLCRGSVALTHFSCCVGGGV